MHFQRIGCRFVIPVIDIVVEDFAVHRAAGFQHQARKQGVFFWRQLQQLSVQPNLTTRDVEAQIFDGDFVVALVQVAAKQGANTGVELFQREGFYQIVICAGIKTANAIFRYRGR